MALKRMIVEIGMGTDPAGMPDEERGGVPVIAMAVVAVRLDLKSGLGLA